VSIPNVLWVTLRGMPIGRITINNGAATMQPSTLANGSLRKRAILIYIQPPPITNGEPTVLSGTFFCTGRASAAAWRWRRSGLSADAGVREVVRPDAPRCRCSSSMATGSTRLGPASSRAALSAGPTAYVQVRIDEVHSVLSASSESWAGWSRKIVVRLYLWFGATGPCTSDC
jgi:hypothetical protein